MKFNHLKRREFITLLGGMTTRWPVGARAKQADRLRRIAALLPWAESDSEQHQRLTLFQQGLAKLGWHVDRNVHIDYRYAAGDLNHMRAQAAELVELAPDVILAGNTPTLDALRRQTRTIPTVFVLVSDPIGGGFVQSLARPWRQYRRLYPGGALIGWQVAGEIAPAVSRVAVIFNPDTAPYFPSYLRPIEAAVPSFGVDLVVSPIHTSAEIESTLTKLGHNGGVVVIPETFTSFHRELIIVLTARHGLPAVYPARYFVTDGGLMSHAANTDDAYRQVASYVSAILRGAKPADLLVQAPTKYEFVINLKTAKTLGLEVPLALLIRADEVIE
jgi:putative ABC transport system substrate-binding protein